MAFIHHFEIDVPPFTATQDDSLAWLAEAYARHDVKRTAKHFATLLRRVGAKAPQVQSRAHYLPDFDQHAGVRQLFDNTAHVRLEDRMAFFEGQTRAIFGRLLSAARPVDELFHVTCTGYVSPSPAQRWVVEHDRHQQTRVRHIYHMGCYASLPALHQANAACAMGKSVQVCHTELCSLHFDPASASLESMVVHSLFADGACAYQMSPAQPLGSSLRYRLGHEELIPGTEEAMSWGLSDSGFQMTLSKDVPGAVKTALPEILKRALGASSGLVDDPRTLWAIHPGGPRIVEELRDLFLLKDGQVQYSNKILRERGNMSSATLPHIWNEILQDDTVPGGTHVLTMAFGPGLTVSVAHLEVCR